MSKDSDHIIDISFDILSLAALFLVPRICALLSLVPFFGTLIPCLKEMVRYDRFRNVHFPGLTRLSTPDQRFRQILGDNHHPVLR